LKWELKGRRPRPNLNLRSRERFIAVIRDLKSLGVEDWRVWFKIETGCGM